MKDVDWSYKILTVKDRLGRLGKIRIGTDWTGVYGCEMVQ